MVTTSMSKFILKSDVAVVTCSRLDSLRSMEPSFYFVLVSKFLGSCLVIITHVLVYKGERDFISRDGHIQDFIWKKSS